MNDIRKKTLAQFYYTLWENTVRVSETDIQLEIECYNAELERIFQFS